VKSREIPRKFKLIAVQGHSRSPILVQIKSVSRNSGTYALPISH